MHGAACASGPVLVDLVGHNPYACDEECGRSHEDDRCSRCGTGLAADDRRTVAYVLGFEVQGIDCGCYRWVQLDRWVTFCMSCDDIGAGHH